MNLRLLVVLIILVSLSINRINGQEGIPCDSLKASVSCETAPIICDLNCLDGFGARMPNFLSSSDSLRKILCPSLGGQPSNMSWFAFVAGSTTIELEVLLDNCIPGVQVDLGVQSAIYSTCAIDINGNVSQNNVLDCYAPTTANVNDFVLSSDQFIIGQVYYFFIDGYAGTICDYEINVLQGSQPFELDDLQSLVTTDSIPPDTICLGYKNYSLRPISQRLNIDYFWKITPATADYPDTYRLLDYKTNWNFNFPGDYEISVYATNGCDITDTVVQNITVMPLPKEVFDTVTVCFNDFPYDGPLTQDPNGDGVIGWLGPKIPYPGGLSTHNVTIASSGCKYIQEVFVSDLPPKPRANVTVFSCGPLDYHGTVFSTSVANQNITLDGLTAAGCDSLVSLTATIVNIEGNIGIVNCDNGGLKIGFIIDNIVAPSNYTLKYQWFDTNGPLVDNDAVDSDIVITKRDFYSVDITMYYGTDSCTFNIPAELIDPDDTKPQITAEDWTLNICDDDNIGEYKIISDQPIKNITWSIPTGAIITVGTVNTDKIEVDFTNSGSGIIGVTVENFCNGISSLDFPVEITATPTANFNLDNEICRETELTLQSTGSTDPSFQYFWRLPSQAIITSGNLDSPGPIDIEFNGPPGNYPIQLIISNGSCRDSFSNSIEVLPDVPELTISCNSLATSVTFNWLPEPCASSYIIKRGGTVIDEITELSYVFDNLATNETVDIQIEVVSNCQCKGSITLASCTALSCDDVNLTLQPSENFICEDKWVADLPLYVTGGSNTGTYTFSGNFVSENGTFDALSAGAGTHIIQLEFEENGCIFNASTSVTLHSLPSLDLNIYDPQCIDELLGSIEVLALGGSGNYSYFLDSQKVGAEVDDIDVGNHTIQIIDGNSCEVLRSFNINPAPVITYDILGNTEIYESQIMDIVLRYTMSEVSVVDSISWYINGVLYCSGLDCSKINLTHPEPGTYEHKIIIHYNDCIIEEEYLVLVKETSKVFIPQIFSPNKDGLNDYWSITTNDPTLIIDQVSIFDRWGNIAFSKKDFQPYSEPQLWDGSFNGRTLQPGVYMLLIDYIDEFGGKQLIKKDITIIY